MTVIKTAPPLSPIFFSPPYFHFSKDGKPTSTRGGRVASSSHESTYCRRRRSIITHTLVEHKKTGIHQSCSIFFFSIQGKVW